MDVSTRFPEDIQSCNVTAKWNVEELLDIFTRYRLTTEIQSDQGSNFTSKLFKEVMDSLGVKQLRTIQNHREC